MYTINGKEFELKKKITLKVTAKIVRLLKPLNPAEQGLQGGQSGTEMVLSLAEGDGLGEILKCVLEVPGEENFEELYPEDLPEIARAITDFFSQKMKLNPNTAQSLQNSPSSKES